MALNPHARSVLIATADEATRRVVAERFARAGFHVSEASTGEEALASVAELLPSVVVLDLQLADMTGYEACHELRQELGEACPIVFVSGERTEPYDRVAGLLIGADDYLTKPFDPGELLARARRLIARSPTDARAEHPRLTPREYEVLRLLAHGLNQNRIARKLFISPRTVETHIERILRKLGAHSRAEAVAHAYRRRLIEPE